ncbi:MAG: hypothetical protein WBX19_14900, partial [Terracidiphilus sp.]
HSVSFYGSIAFGLEIPSHSVAVAGILPSVTPSHEVFFAQHLAVKQPRRGGQIDERNQVREQQELPKQDKPERDIHWIAAKAKDPGCHQLIRTILINTDSETFAKRYQAQE